MSRIGDTLLHTAVRVAALDRGTSPRVSVLMAVYNGARFLREAVDSVLGQTLADLELIVVDDASTDDTPAILDSYGDPRLVRLRKERNVGPYRARNWALPRCRGQYIAPMDADDVSMPTRLEKQARYLDEHPEVVLVSANMEVTDEAGRHLDQTDSAGDPGAIAWELLFYNRGAGHGQVMFRRDTLLKIGGYPVNHRYSQDYALWLSMLEQGRVAVLPDVLLKYRRHGSSVGVRDKEEQEAYAVAISRGALGKVLGAPLPEAEVRKLRDFWSGTSLVQGDVGSISETLRRVRKAFLESRGPADGRRARSRAVRRATAKRFLAWSQTCGALSQPGMKLACLWEALGWAAGPTVRHCLASGLQVPLRLLGSVVRPTAEERSAEQ